MEKSAMNILNNIILMLIKLINFYEKIKDSSHLKPHQKISVENAISMNIDRFCLHKPRSEKV